MYKSKAYIDSQQQLFYSKSKSQTRHFVISAESFLFKSKFANSNLLKNCEDLKTTIYSFLNLKSQKKIS